jgi:hypothetical protein
MFVGYLQQQARRLATTDHRRRLLFNLIKTEITFVGYLHQQAWRLATTDHRRRLLFDLIIDQRSRSSVTYSNKRVHYLLRIIVVGYYSINYAFAIALVGYFKRSREH